MSKSSFIFENPRILILERRLEELSDYINRCNNTKSEVPDQIKREISHNLKAYSLEMKNIADMFDSCIKPTTMVICTSADEENWLKQLFGSNLDLLLERR